MDQVSMGRMDFDNPKSGFTGTPCGLCEGIHDPTDLLTGEGSRHAIAFRKWQCTRSHYVCPASFALRNCAVALPGSPCTRLASCMSQLHAGNAALLMDKPDNTGQELDMLVAPDAKVLRTDTRLRQDGRGLGKHYCRTPHRATA